MNTHGQHVMNELAKASHQHNSNTNQKRSKPKMQCILKYTVKSPQSQTRMTDRTKISATTTVMIQEQYHEGIRP